MLEFNQITLDAWASRSSCKQKRGLDCSLQKAWSQESPWEMRMAKMAHANKKLAVGVIRRAIVNLKRLKMLL